MSFMKELKHGRRFKRIGKRPRRKVSMSDAVHARLAFAAIEAELYIADVIEALVMKHLPAPPPGGETPHEEIHIPVEEDQPEIGPEPNDDDDWIEGI